MTKEIPSFPPPPPPPQAPPLFPKSPESDSTNNAHSFDDGTALPKSSYSLSVLEEELNSTLSSFKKCSYKLSIPPDIPEGVLQQGPSCGLAALQMALDQASRASHRNASYSASEIRSRAQRLGFTVYGEMFSCSNMLALAETMFRHARLSLVESSSLGIDDRLERRKDVVDLLNSGGMILVPYDKDGDFRPCSKKGRKAHWALLIGVATIFSGKAFVAARHGKSKRIHFWDLDDLLLSNSQLFEYDYNSLCACDGGATPVIPRGGLKEGLAGKMIFISINESE